MGSCCPDSHRTLIQSQNYQVPVPRWLGGSLPPVLMFRASFQPQSIQDEPTRQLFHSSAFSAAATAALCGWYLPTPCIDAAHLSSCILHSQTGAAPPAPWHRIPCPQGTAMHRRDQLCPGIQAGDVGMSLRCEVTGAVTSTSHPRSENPPCRKPKCHLCSNVTAQSQLHTDKCPGKLKVQKNAWCSIEQLRTKC